MKNGSKIYPLIFIYDSWFSIKPSNLETGRNTVLNKFFWTESPPSVRSRKGDFLFSLFLQEERECARICKEALWGCLCPFLSHDTPDREYHGRLPSLKRLFRPFSEKRDCRKILVRQDRNWRNVAQGTVQAGSFLRSSSESGWYRFTPALASSVPGCRKII